MTGRDTQRSMDTSREAGAVWALCGLYGKRHSGKWSRERMEGGPLVLATLLDMPQRPSLDRCCRSSCFFLGGFRVSCRTEKPRSGMCCKRRARQTQVAPPEHPPAQTHTAPTHLSLHHPASLSPRSSTGGLLMTWAGSQRAAACAVLHPYMSHRYLGTRGLRRFLSLPRRVALPTDPAPQWQHMMLPAYEVLNQVHTNKAGSTVLTSPPIPVLSPALRMVWPGSQQQKDMFPCCFSLPLVKY